jgi:hypothetical protein
LLYTGRRETQSHNLTKPQSKTHFAYNKIQQNALITSVSKVNKAFHRLSAVTYSHES